MKEAARTSLDVLARCDAGRGFDVGGRVCRNHHLGNLDPAKLRVGPGQAEGEGVMVETWTLLVMPKRLRRALMA